MKPCFMADYNVRYGTPNEPEQAKFPGMCAKGLL